MSDGIFHAITSQKQPARQRPRSARTIAERLLRGLGALFTPRFDPTRLSKAARRDAGLPDCDVALFEARKSPLVK